MEYAAVTPEAALFGFVMFMLGVAIGVAIPIILRRRRGVGASVAEASPERVAPAAPGADAPRWRPPYVSGPELLAWARSVGRGAVREVARDGLGERTASELVQRLGPGLTQAMLPDAGPAERAERVPCPGAGQGVVGVTGAEAIALAEWLRSRLGPDELEELGEDITLCDEWIGNGAAGVPCALQGEDRTCTAYGSHPFACRPTLAMTLAMRLREESGAPEGVRSFGDVHVETVARGVMEGIQDGLERAGLDSTRYELHSALRRALGRPDAAEAWVRGEDLFEACRVVGRAERTRRPGAGH